MDSLADIILEIRARRMSQELSQAEVAKRMGCTVGFVQAIEYRDKVDRRWGTILAYAEAVGVELHVEVDYKAK